MQAFFDPQSRRHAPQFFVMRGRVVPHEDAPERVGRLLAGLGALGLTPKEPANVPPGVLATVHTPRYLEFLSTAWDAWQALPQHGAEVLANVQPRALGSHYPDGLVGRAGWHLGDLACPIGPHTAEAALASASSAYAAADAILAGEHAAYALCRPPGHHASAEVAGGHCYINNAAVAAAHIAEAGRRVAILDIDVHHGNGTQAIFYDRADILTVSVHADPNAFYPWFTGYADERGVGEGEGANRNIPLPLGADDTQWLNAVDRAIAQALQHAPHALVVSAGFDVHADDPLAGFCVTTPAICEAGARIAATGFPVAIVQEGGYMSAVLTENLAAFLAPFVERAA